MDVVDSCLLDDKVSWYENVTGLIRVKLVRGIYPEGKIERLTRYLEEKSPKNSLYLTLRLKVLQISLISSLAEFIIEFQSGPTSGARDIKSFTIKG